MTIWSLLAKEVFIEDVLYKCSNPCHLAAFIYLEVNGRDEGKKRVCFILLGGSLGGRFFTVPTCSFWLLSSSVFQSLASIQCKWKDHRKNPLRQKVNKKNYDAFHGTWAIILPWVCVTQAAVLDRELSAAQGCQSFILPMDTTFLVQTGMDSNVLKKQWWKSFLQCGWIGFCSKGW